MVGERVRAHRRAKPGAPILLPILSLFLFPAEGTVLASSVLAPAGTGRVRAYLAAGLTASLVKKWEQRLGVAQAVVHVQRLHFTR